jgi:aminomethyltransferase
MQKGAPYGMVFSSMQTMNIRRIEAGILDSGSDFDSSMTPFEAGLERFINLDKDNFIGHEALAVAPSGTRLYGVRCDGVIPKAGDLILEKSSPVGKITTGAQSPYLECGIGYVRFDHPGDWRGKTLSLLTADYREVSCKIVTLPFYDEEKRLPRRLDLGGNDPI